jgi:eukaryotic-like serine/threonine-protein kinase
MIGETLGHYRIQSKIASGGMGEVYLARDERLERDVALKILPAHALADESARKRFRKEALALSKLNHPNIATIYDFDTVSGVDFLAMEYVQGETLAQRLASGSISEKEIAALAGQIADSLEDAHEHGIVHRDLKPSNIMVTPKGRVKVLDFGLAKLLRPAGSITTAETLSETQGIAGTLLYMSPEQLQDEEVDARCDIFSFGAVLYESATGQRPFRDEVVSRLIDAILHQSPVVPRAINPRVSPDLERIVLKCLEKDPALRYQSAKEVGVDIRRLNLPGTTATTAPAKVRRSWMRSPIGLVGSAILLIVILLAVLAALNVGGWRERMRGGTVSSRAIHSVAVLPLENLSHDPDEEYFADGMTEALITSLQQIGALNVISRTSAMRYKATNKAIPEIARELHVDAVVIGTILRSGDKVRVSAQLIDGKTDINLWTYNSVRDSRDVLPLQDDVAQAIASGIQVRITPQEKARLSSSQPVSTEAHEAYLKGLYYFNQGRELSQSGAQVQSFKESIEFFQRAIQLQPDYASAYASLARTYHWDGELEGPEFYEKSLEASRKAVQLNDSDFVAHGALAYVLMVYKWDFVGAEKELKRTFELNPGYSEIHHAFALFDLAMGRHEEAIAEINRAIELDPLTSPQKWNAATIYSCAGQFDRAIEQVRNIPEVDPNNPRKYTTIGQYEILKGNVADGLAEMKKGLELAPTDPQVKYRLAYGYAAAGQRAEAIKILDELKAASTTDAKRPMDPLGAASVFAELGDKDAAFAWLEKAYQAHTRTFVYIKCLPYVGTLKTDPRFQELLRRMGLPR